MNSQDQGKSHTSGHESHGVHLCHVCGWPFPNPHPSARHRRAHKKICGTIEGYKLVHSEGSPHLAVSDDEHVSDEDRKTPSPKFLERSNDERGSSGIGQKSNRSEDEVFADAVAEFPDSGSNLTIEEHVEEVKEATAVNVGTSLENAPITAQPYLEDTVSLPKDSADSSQMQNSEIHGSILSTTKQESGDPVLSTTIDLTEKSLIKQSKESPDELSNAKGGSAFDFSPTELETKTDASKDNDNNTDNKNLREVDVKGDEENNLVRNLSHVVPANVDDVQASESVTELGKPEGIASDPSTTGGLFQSREEHPDELGNKMPASDIFSEVETVEYGSFDTNQSEKNAVQIIESTLHDNSIQACSVKKEGNESVYELSVPDDIPVVKNDETVLKGFKDHKRERSPLFVDADTLEVINDHRNPPTEDNSSVLISKLSDEGVEVSASDAHGLKDNSEQKGLSSMLKGEGLPYELETVMPQTKVAGSENQKLGEGIHNNIMEVEIESSHTVQLFKEQPYDNSNDSLPKASQSEATEVFNEPIPMVAQTNTEVRQATELIGMDDKENFEKARSERGVAADNDGKDDVMKERCIRATSELEGNSRMDLCQDNNAMDNEERKTKGHGGKNAMDNEESKTKVYGSSSIETEEVKSISGLVEESPSVQSDIVLDSASNHSGFNIACESANDAPAVKLAEIEGTELARVSDGLSNDHENPINDKVRVECTGVTTGAASIIVGPTPQTHDASEAVVNSPQTTLAEVHRGLDNQEGTKELEVGDDNKVIMESVVSVCAEPNRDINVQVATNSMENHKSEVPQVSPIDISSAIQDSTAVDNHDMHCAQASSADKIPSVSDENDNNFVAQQLNASITDFSVDSSSQTDSLEGHWGSVSVLSTQSDIPAMVDSEPLLSNGLPALAEAEKPSSHKPKRGAEEQHSEKSDVFEAPSFMTLVEPMGGADQKPTTSGIQTTQNQQQPATAQPGWFPSITHVVNESQGRKKNEEIIAKVTNWSTGKEHTPLKNLLGEANAETKSKTPNVKENLPPAVQKDETTSKDNNTPVTTVSSILGPQEPIAEPPVEKEAGKEWNSPARFPTDVKREKRKVKGRPYWAQFVCCSSAN